MIKDLIRQNRSYRRFYESERISREILTGLVELARLSPSGGNLQPLKYFLSNTTEANAKIFDCLAWAGYLKGWDRPEPGERPSAYIVILGDKSIKDPVKHDPGIAAQSMLLGAVETGLGGCIIGSVKRELLRENLEIPSHLDILLVLALGKPKEKVVLEAVDESGDIRYWRDENGVHHVPKRLIENLII
jgi:nitroreductase